MSVEKFDTKDGGTLVVTYDEGRDNTYYPSNDVKLEEIIRVNIKGESEIIFGGGE